MEFSLAIAEAGSNNANANVMVASDSMKRLVSLVNLCPHGPMRFQPHNLGEVESSINFAKIELNPSDPHAVISFMARFGLPSQATVMQEYVEALFDLAGGFATKPSEGFPGWVPNLDSDLFRKVFAAVKDVYGTEPGVYSIHAGLECGLLMGRYPSLKAVSIGPQIIDAHTPHESFL